jgi:plasmid stabilization system protein ParE
MSYSVTPLAQSDIDEITETIWGNNPSSAEAFVETVFEAFDKIAAVPGMGHKRSDLTTLPVLFWTIHRFNVAIVYRAQPSVEILRVVNWRRDVPALLSAQTPTT